MGKWFGNIKELRSTTLRIFRREKEVIEITWDGENLLVYKNGDLYKTVSFEEDSVSGADIRHEAITITGDSQKISFLEGQGGGFGTTSYTLQLTVVHPTTGGQVFYTKGAEEEDGFWIDTSGDATVTYTATKL